MNESTSAFWYRPFWQQSIPFWAVMSLILLAYFQFYWQEIEYQLTELKNETQHLAVQSQQKEKIRRQLPSLQQLDQQLIELEQKFALAKQDSAQFITYLQQIVTHTNVTLKRLHPSTNRENNEQRYFIEVQGNYPEIYHFIDNLISTLSHQTGGVSEVNFQSKNGQLTAILTITFIKDDIINE